MADRVTARRDWIRDLRDVEGRCVRIGSHTGRSDGWIWLIPSRRPSSCEDWLTQSGCRMAARSFDGWSLRGRMVSLWCNCCVAQGLGSTVLRLSAVLPASISPFCSTSRSASALSVFMKVDIASIGREISTMLLAISGDDAHK
ncbi:hypothetical protein THER5_2016 [Bifidobacterium thermacidophilum subsp. thermacidophilum]|uniref:Uncharacterized protein n=1 Tax=Bifidobacterium thermacidophilum subsp. thermacidophilum TaxID=79262 RepID=A0A087E124_9BIFI|nr:hypothetical protein THER5_2016 [Bifidobacterium thermacidophilum subsp. thermacidophilum]